MKKAKGAKTCVIKRKPKFENYENSLEATRLQNKINYLKENKINIDSLKKINKQVIKKHSKDLKVRGITFLLKKLTRLL